jgi:hypothetical protein
MMARVTGIIRSSLATESIQSLGRLPPALPLLRNAAMPAARSAMKEVMG